MKVLAFLQNQWVREPDRVKESIARYGEPWRRRFISMALFSGCLTGRRLKAALGEDWCQKIIWEEASTEIGGNGRSYFPPDLAHVRRRVVEENPDCVILFGKSNLALVSGVAPFVIGGMVITAPHPAARGAGIPADLKKLADRLNTWGKL